MEKNLLALSRSQIDPFSNAIRRLDEGIPWTGEDQTIEVDADALKRALALGLNLLPKNVPLGDDLFGAVAARSITIAHEAVCLRWRPDASKKPDGSRKVQVRLVNRPRDAKAYPGQSHSPGTAQRPGETEEGSFRRLMQSEFCAGITSRRKVGEFENFHEERGHYKQIVWLCEVAEGSQGYWCDTDALPPNIVDHHRDIVIPMAEAYFRAQELTK